MVYLQDLEDLQHIQGRHNLAGDVQDQNLLDDPPNLEIFKIIKTWIHKVFRDLGDPVDLEVFKICRTSNFWLQDREYLQEHEGHQHLKYFPE